MTEPQNRPKNASEETPEERRFRMRHAWQDLIEDLITEGQEKGLFDGLKGTGKPLNYNKNPYAPDLEFAHTLLKENDLAPGWISNRKEIMAQIAGLRAEMVSAWQAHDQLFAQVGSQDQSRLIISWDDACRRWQDEMVKINKRIGDYNLKRPIERLELFKLTLESELQRIGARRYL